MYLIHQHYCNAMAWDNSYVYIRNHLIDVQENIHQFIYSCISNCDVATSEMIYYAITNAMESDETSVVKIISWVVIQVFPANLPSNITTIFIDNYEDNYKIKVINFSHDDITNLYSSL